MSLHQLKKRFIRQQVQKQIQYRTETMDGILWDILSDKLCRVRILNTDTLLIAKYPENIEQKPAWLKPGTAVKVLHTGGNRHMLEVIGLGIGIPNPTLGSTLPAFPTIASGEDTVIDSGDATPPVGTSVTNDYTSSMMIYAWEVACMKIWVAVGLLRIAGTIYAAETITLNESSLGDLACGAPIDEIHEAVTISAAHSSLYRIDRIVVGADLVVDVLTGTPSAAPVAPDTTANHVSLGTVFIPPGVTAIYPYQINAGFSPATPCQLVVSITDGSLAYAEHSTTITVSVKDQYNNPYLATQVSIKMTFDRGTGYIDGGTESTRTTPSGSNQVTFTYSRDLNRDTYSSHWEPPADPPHDPESSPLLRSTLIQMPSIYMISYIMLYDYDGNLLP